MLHPLRLHYAPDNASLCVRLALEEIGIAHDTVLVDRRVCAQSGPAYLALNPNGLIPTLETPVGPIFETSAILLWLAEQSDGVFPVLTEADRAIELKWFAWLANTLHPALRMLFYPEKYIDATFSEDLRRTTRLRIGALLDMLEASDSTFLEAPHPSISACYLAPMLRWPALYGGRTDWYALSSWPRLLRFAQTFELQPAAQRVTKAEGLGPTPFSAPRLPDPPEGSAT